MIFQYFGNLYQYLCLNFSINECKKVNCQLQGEVGMAVQKSRDKKSRDSNLRYMLNPHFFSSDGISVPQIPLLMILA